MLPMGAGDESGGPRSQSVLDEEMESEHQVD